MSDEHAFWASKGNIIWIALAVFTLVLHVIVQHQYPAFTPPASLSKPDWMRVGLYVEFLIHLLILGAVITAIWNSIPSLRSPSYSDDGTLTIGSLEQSDHEAVRWTEIVIVTAEFVLYLVLWALVYGII